MEASKGPSWKVTGQHETTDVGPAGLFVQGYRVTFVLADGTVGSVFVPKDRYTVANVMAAIAPHAAELEAVAALSRGTA